MELKKTMTKDIKEGIIITLHQMESTKRKIFFFNLRNFELHQRGSTVDINRQKIYLEDTLIKIMQNGEKRMGENGQVSGKCGRSLSTLICIMGVSDEGKEKNRKIIRRNND